jgi:hypothetical protein
MWWQYLIAAVVVIFAIWGFVSVVKLQTHRLSDKTDNTAEDVYDRYSDSLHKQRKYAADHGGEWRNEE